MKKIFMSIMAFAAIAMTMTSCNKDEAVSTDLTMTFEESEVMNDVKMHFEGDDQYWDNNDRIYVIDGNSNYAYYTVNPGSAPVFERSMRGDFNVHNGPLVAIYPYNIYAGRHAVRIAPRQYSINGNISTTFPMFAEGTVDNFPWNNLCGVLRLHVKGDGIQIDSVSVTADQYLNGVFNVNLNNTNPLTYQANGHGTKTNTVRFNNPIVTNLTDPQVINIYLPAGDYNSLNITFYSGNQKLVKRNNASVNISRSQYNNRNFTLNIDDFETFTKGAIDVVYNVGTGNVIFSKGNFEYVSANNQYMNFAGNQWDFRGTTQHAAAADHDLFAWGANGYYVSGRLVGNGIKIWQYNRTFTYCTETSLTGANEWGNDKIANGGNVANSGWRTLTAAEMEYLIDPTHYTHAMVTLSFVGKQGLIILPAGFTPDFDLADGTSLNKSQWNALEAAGCIFFVADNYRTASSSMANTGSYFWLNTAADENTASALVVDKTAGASIANFNKKIGGFVRLVKDVE